MPLHSSFNPSVAGIILESMILFINNKKIFVIKKLTIISAFILIAGFSHTANAQVVKKTRHAAKKGATAAGNKTAEMASKSKSMVTDKVYKAKMGPSGQTI